MRDGKSRRRGRKRHFRLMARPAGLLAGSYRLSRELVWGGQVDLCPDALYLKVTGKEPEDVFPALRHEPVHA